MTIGADSDLCWGWDASDFDWSRNIMNLPSAAADGIRLFTHKYTESNNVKHVNAGKALSAARAAGIPLLGGYHVVRTTSTIAAQVAYLLAYADQVTPWWRMYDGWFWQADLELWPYDAVPASWGLNFCAALRAAQPKPVVLYASKGQYGTQCAGKGFPLWNANYGTNPVGHYPAVYPGDGSARWAGWELFLQYNSVSTIGAHRTCDANSARASVAQVRAALGMGGSMPAGSADKAFDTPYTGYESWVSHDGWMAKAVEAPLNRLLRRHLVLATDDEGATVWIGDFVTRSPVTNLADKQNALAAAGYTADEMAVQKWSPGTIDALGQPVNTIDVSPDVAAGLGTTLKTALAEYFKSKFGS